MGLIASGAIGAQVIPSASHLGAGIHDVKFTGVQKAEGIYTALEVSFEDANGAVHNERLFEPSSDERKPSRFNASVLDPSQSEQFTCKLMQIIEALNPDIYTKIVTGKLKFAPVDFDTLVTQLTKILDPAKGKEVQIKLLPNGRFVGFPGFPAKLDKGGNVFVNTSFIGESLTLSAYEKSQIDKARDARPTPAPTSELDDMKTDLDEDEDENEGAPSVDEDEDENEGAPSVDDDDLPF